MYRHFNQMAGTYKSLKSNETFSALLSKFKKPSKFWDPWRNVVNTKVLIATKCSVWAWKVKVHRARRKPVTVGSIRGFFKGRTVIIHLNKQNNWSHLFWVQTHYYPTRSYWFSFNMDPTPNFSKVSLDERRTFAIDLTCQVYLLCESNHILCRINGKVIIICFVGFNVRGGNLSIFRDMFYVFIGFTLFYCHSCFATGYTVKATF